MMDGRSNQDLFYSIPFNIIEVVGKERGRQWTNWDVNDLSLKIKHNREGAYMNPKTMPTDMNRYAPRTKAYAAATS